MSDACPVAPGRPCDTPSILADVVGLISARLARLDLGVCLLLAARGEAAVLHATGGHLGYSEAQPLHRAAGWWCAGQSALHSLAYFFFYLRAGGAASLWQACFPAPLPDGSLNRLGLVNFMGVVAIAVCGPLALSALPLVRRRCYHAFQRLHMPVALLFVTCCALHDLAILTFAVPGIAFWYVEWRGRGGRKGVLGCSLRRFTATARLLPGTSGPWAELTIHCGGAALGHDAAPRGEWALPLGTEWHPLSVTSAGGRTAGLSALVSARGGDWTKALVHLCATTGSFEVELAGPFPFGGGPWSLSGGGGGGEPALLLLAGGTGVTGWLPALAAAASEGRPCRLVWCVQNEADYHALADRLPRNGGVEWGWAYVAEALELPLDAGWLHHSLVGYTLSRRCLPVLLIVASIAATTAAKRLVVAACGPASMVEGARSAVAKIRAECRGEGKTKPIRIAFPIFAKAPLRLGAGAGS
ncbi:hypothetical protein EMIHUDRAFT_241644 [Emiliania huxleyi CCMP1516]|uniref:Ferric oxidoreductase domain-containing protein n=2 Tax=Emiliania huxleyi TaxID=2903 RepID=A0A0D3JC61_EMIH1|nr:hypothetical protein EMIHUDRAFT_241644 [Emiliania huxleyi CCMP1516]EOD21096.1 hypothetical protein EMIHUDRAFT_241644 [Emiliania huxleyi CCMP1516]|eukprot:XP_005773525.1 hypothetical protein EMIHUDRAFT_241644 [Emiliania huxleyi CCMP1516]